MCETVTVIVGDPAAGQGVTLSSVADLCGRGWWPALEDLVLEWDDQATGEHQRAVAGPLDCLCSVDTGAVLNRNDVTYVADVFGLTVQLDELPPVDPGWDQLRSVLIAFVDGAPTSVSMPVIHRLIAYELIEPITMVDIFTGGGVKPVVTDLGRTWVTDFHDDTARRLAKENPET